MAIKFCETCHYRDSFCTCRSPIASSISMASVLSMIATFAAFCWLRAHG